MSAARGVLALVLVVAAVAAAWFLLRSHSASASGGSAQAGVEVAADDPGAEWRAEVRLEQLTERRPDYEASRLTVVLRDAKGREIETPDVAFELDGVPLVYRVGQGNYYDRHPYYRADEDSGFTFAPAARYELAVRRGGGPASPFATLQTPGPLSPDDFRLPASHPRDRDLAIGWSAPGQSLDLLVYKTVSFTDEAGNQGFVEGGPQAEDALRQHLDPGGAPGEGQYTVPASFLTDSQGREATTVTLEITAPGEGKFLHPVLKGSVLSVLRKVILRVDVVNP